MKWLVIFLSTMLSALTAFGSACCGGAGPKSFISLQDLQSYEIGMSTSVRNVYGHYTVYGEPEKSDTAYTYTLAFGGGARISEALEAFGIIPIVYQVNTFSNSSLSRSSLGDILFGGRYTLVKSLFQDDWYPTVMATAGVKLPIGAIEAVSNGKILPGTGNGMWEPFIGIALKKEYGFVTLAVDGTYTFRVRKKDPLLVQEGDKFEISEMATFLFSRRFSAGIGSRQTWTLASTQNGTSLEDSAGRATTALVSATYFLNRLWSVIGSIEYGIPIKGFGVNQQLSQVASLTTKYGFF